MAQLYVRSSDGDDADNGSTWALAKATAVSAAGIEAAGDVINLASTHSEGGTGTTMTLALAGTLASPNWLLSVSDAAEPPTALSAGATLIASTLTIQGNVYAEGLTLEAASNLQLATVSSQVQHYKNCKLRSTGASTGNRISVGVNGAGVEAKAVLEDCTFRFANASQRVTVFIGRCHILGGSVEAGGTALTSAFMETSPGGRPGTYQIDNFDFSNLASSCSLLSATNGAGRFIIRGSKLPASWTGSLATGTYSPGFRAEMYDCASGDTHLGFWLEDYAGSVREESTIVKTGGSAKSQKFVTSANAEYPHQVLIGPEFFIPNTATGSAITVKADTVTDNVTLTDGEAWIEVFCKTTSGSTLMSLTTDAKASVLASAASQTTNSETWTTTGLTTPVRQELSVSVTPQETGTIIARVVVARPSTTVYVDAPRKV